MGKRTYKADITGIALLYTNEYLKSTMLSCSKIDEYYNQINKNLDEMKSSCALATRRNCFTCEEELFFFVTNEDGKKYAVINPKADIKKAWHDYIGLAPYDILVASQKANALNIIGLKLVDGKMVPNK